MGVRYTEGVGERHCWLILSIGERIEGSRLLNMFLLGLLLRCLKSKSHHSSIIYFPIVSEVRVIRDGPSIALRIRKSNLRFLINPLNRYRFKFPFVRWHHREIQVTRALFSKIKYQIPLILISPEASCLSMLRKHWVCQVEGRKFQIGRAFDDWVVSSEKIDGGVVQVTASELGAGNTDAASATIPDKN